MGVRNKRKINRKKKKYNGPKREFNLGSNWLDNLNKILKGIHPKSGTYYKKERNIMHDSTIISFFEERTPDSEGRMFDEILEKNYDWMEFCHDYIQWFFPLKEASAFNPDAPILTDEDISYFRKSDENSILIINFEASIEKFLSFLGLRFKDNEIEQTEEYNERQYTWATAFNHNHLRITRMLTSMVLLGYGSKARTIYDYISKTGGSDVSKEYWKEAVGLA